MQKNNLIISFAKHCLSDPEWLAGGIPAKEKYYFWKLDWTPEDASEFYKALGAIYCMARDLETERNA